MEALIFADRRGNDLLPLTRRLPVSILPINGKPLVEYSLEDLASADVRSAMVVLGEGDESVREALGSGSRWNMDLKFVQSNQGETPTDVARRYAEDLSESFLALRGDVFRFNTIRSFRKAANSVLATQVVAQIKGESAQLCLCRRRDIQIDSLTWRERRQRSDASDWRTVELDAAGFSRMRDVTDFYLTNIDNLERMAGASGNDESSGHRNIFQGKNSTFTASSLRDGAIQIGNNCHIDPSVKLFGPVVIGDNVTIAAGAFLHACIVMPGANIAEDAFFRNAVISSEQVLGLDGSVVCRFGDQNDAETVAVA